jgi:hypothetical protein
MPPRRKQDPQEAKPKRFTVEDIEAGIRKLKRRIDEVKTLDPTKVRFDDARVQAQHGTSARTSSKSSDRTRPRMMLMPGTLSGIRRVLEDVKTASISTSSNAVCRRQSPCWRA